MPLADDWWESNTTTTEDITGACRELPIEFRTRWALSVLETLGEECLNTRIYGGLAGNRSFVAAKYRRIAIHVMREVCGLTIPQIAPLVQMTVFGASNAAHKHRERHRYTMDYKREASEVGMCDSWLRAFAEAMYECYEEEPP